MERITLRELRNEVSAVLLRVMTGERLRVTVSGRDAVDLIPIDADSSWTVGSKARELILGAQADAALATESDQAFPDVTDRL